MPTNVRLPPKSFPTRSNGARTRRRSTIMSYVLFYSIVGLGTALLIFTGVASWSPKPVVVDLPATQHVATIRLNQGAGNGRCRLVNFDNATGHFAEAGAAPCPNDIPETLLVPSADRARARTEAISKSFR